MLLTTLLLAQIAVAPQAPAPRHVAPVLAFPEPGLDDSAAYQGYQTRFYRDVAGNTVQLYLDREGRVVNLWADAEDESLGFSVRDPRGTAAPLHWGGDSAAVSSEGRRRTLEYSLESDARRIDLGLFLLGSMRVERDFQYAGRQREALTAAPFRVAETDDLVAAMQRLDPVERRRQLAVLGARDVATLRARLQPRIATGATRGEWHARVVQPSLDGRDTLVLEIGADPRRVAASRTGSVVSLRARGRSGVRFTVRITTTGRALTPLAREEIFTPEFLAFLAAAKGAAGDGAMRARWLERQTRGVELLVSREKLMAGLPNYATYFGRDMLVTALMMRTIWRGEMSEFAVAAALRKLGPAGDVSHEEALGGQAVREGAREYATVVAAALRARGEGRRAAADSLLARARALLGDLRRTRENYHMIDDELQLAVLAGRWLADSTVSPERKRAFLLDSSDGGGTRAARLLRELALVSRMTGAYARDPVVGNLISFARRDSTHWSSASWRDSGAGYANGRWAMDINAIWAPHALESISRILASMRALGISTDSIARARPDVMSGSPLEEWSRDSLALRRAIDTWWGAEQHFVVRLDAAAVHERVTARVAAMPAAEREYWTALLQRTGADRDSLTFLALALDEAGRPIGVANSDVATRLFLGDGERGARQNDLIARELRDVRLFTRSYPVGLLIDEVGPVVANDAYASPEVWRAFERDSYHGPKVVWGREVNLFLLGVASRIGARDDAAGDAPELRAAFQRVLGAVEASGFHSELWSYEVRDGRVVPARYGIASDVQLWSTTDLAVQFARARLMR